MHFLSLFGTLTVLPVISILSAYSGSCKCECCAGGGCSPRLALIVVSWVCFALACLIIPDCLLEPPQFATGKVGFGVLQCVSMLTMGASRVLGNGEEEGSGSSNVPVGVLVGSPVEGPEDLQERIGQLQVQIRDLLQLQNLQTAPRYDVWASGHGAQS